MDTELKRLYEALYDPKTYRWMDYDEEIREQQRIKDQIVDRVGELCRTDNEEPEPAPNEPGGIINGR